MAPIVRPPCNQAGRQAEVCRRRTESFGDGQEARLGRRAELPKPDTGMGERPWIEAPEPQRGPRSFSGPPLALRDRVRGVAGSRWPCALDRFGLDAACGRVRPCAFLSRAGEGQSFGGPPPRRSGAATGFVRTSASRDGWSGSRPLHFRSGGRSFFRPFRERLRRETSTLPSRRSAWRSGRLPPDLGG